MILRLAFLAALVAVLAVTVSASQAAIRRSTASDCPNGGRPMPSGATACVLRPFKVWYCRGMLPPEAVYGVAARPGPACKVGIAYYAVYTA